MNKPAYYSNTDWNGSTHPNSPTFIVNGIHQYGIEQNNQQPVMTSNPNIAENGYHIPKYFSQTVQGGSNQQQQYHESFIPNNATNQYSKESVLFDPKNNNYCLQDGKEMKKLDENDSDIKLYGNPYLGENLWEKDHLFQSKKFDKELSPDCLWNEKAENILETMQKTNLLSTIFGKNGQLNVPETEDEMNQKKVNKQFKRANSSSQSLKATKKNLNGEIQPCFPNSHMNKTSSCYDLSEGDNKDDDNKDDKYWMRRKKNNMSAKKSRDARRSKEGQIAVTAAKLEKENEKLRKLLEDFSRENENLKSRLRESLKSNNFY